MQAVKSIRRPDSPRGRLGVFRLERKIWRLSWTTRPVIGKVAAMPLCNAQLVLDDVAACRPRVESSKRLKPLQMKVSAGVAAGTSGAEFIRNPCADALPAPHRRAS